MINKIQIITVAFGDVNSVKSAYSALFEDQIYIRCVETYLCDQVQMESFDKSDQ